MSDGPVDSKWRETLDELVLQALPVPTPEGAKGRWFQVLARFSRTGFVRVLVGEEDEGTLALQVQLAVGEVGGDGEQALRGDVVEALSERSATSWTAERDRQPWELSTRLEGAPDERLRKVMLCLMKVADVVGQPSDDAAQVGGRIREALGLATAAPSTPSTQPAESPAATTGGSPFESIGAGGDGAGAGSQERGSQERGNKKSGAAGTYRVEATRIAIVDDHLEAALGLSAVLSPAETHELGRALSHHLRVRYDVEVTPIEEPRTASLRLGDVHQTPVYLRLERAGTEPRQSLTELERLVEGYFARLEEFSELGVDLFDLLGLRDVTLGSPRGHAARHEASGERPPRFTTAEREAPTKPLPLAGGQREQASGARAPGDDHGEVVLDLSGGATPTSEPAGFAPVGAGGGELVGDTLRPGEFTDPRLQRPDATTPLVDVVLRHPGYSDRRIGQVLSILLSIEYHNALRLAEAAPCVIAWGLSNERARSFKEVIESAGGKAVLVEPGTFGEV